MDAILADLFALRPVRGSTGAWRFLGASILVSLLRPAAFTHLHAARNARSHAQWRPAAQLLCCPYSRGKHHAEGAVLKGPVRPSLETMHLLPVGRVADGAHRPSLCWRRDAPRVTLALAESISLRAVIKPLTFPLKIWASYKLVLAMKRARRGGTATASVAMRYKRRQRQPATS